MFLKLKRRHIFGFFCWSIVGKDLVPSENRDQHDHDEIDLEDDREVFRILLEVAYMHHYNGDKCKKYYDNKKIQSKKNDICRHSFECWSM